MTPRGKRCSTTTCGSGRGETGQPFVPFDPVADYDDYVDGKPRADGTRSFLESRGINLPEGSRRRPARRRDRPRPRQPQERDRAAQDPRGRGARHTPGSVALRPGGQGGGAAPRGGVVQRQLPATCWSRRASTTCSTRGSTGWSPSGSTCAASRPRTRSWPGRSALGLEPARRDRVRGRAGRRGRGPGGRVRVRGRGGPRRAGGGAEASTAPDVVVTDLAELLDHG